MLHLVPLNSSQLDNTPDPRRDVPGQVIADLEAARLRRMVRTLPQLERHVICWRYGLIDEPLTHKQIGRRLGLSATTVWRIERSAMRMLREGYGVDRLRAA